jgi:hypothetical protein
VFATRSSAAFEVGSLTHIEGASGWTSGEATVAFTESTEAVVSRGTEAGAFPTPEQADATRAIATKVAARIDGRLSLVRMREKI